MNRRGFVEVLVGIPLLGCAGNLLAKAFQFPGGPPPNANQFPGSTPPGPTAPGATQRGQAPPDLDQELPPGPKIDAHTVLVYQQKQLKKDVTDLYDLARKLRNQVLKTDSTEVLSMNMLHTAQKIQSLAKHIQDLARG
jgi:hypothetical protein